MRCLTLQRKGSQMKREGLITLILEPGENDWLVSSTEYPLLQLIVKDVDDIAAKVLPVLKAMIEHEEGGRVSLRMVPPFKRERFEASVPSPHVIAEMAA